MREKMPLILAVGLVFAFQWARAGTVNVSIRDASGRPAENAVVELVPQQSGGASGSPNLPEQAIVDQRNETFLPLVSLIRKGGHVVFTNNDTTMHQVYSFADTKQFAFEIDEGQRSAPVVFDRAGVAAIGCNIHDQMITYVYVASEPWALRTDTAGHGQFANVPEGHYRATIWHPQLAAGQSPPSFPLVVSGDASEFSATIALSASDPRAKKHAHMQMY